MPSSLATEAIAAMMVGLSSSGTGGAKASSKKAHPWSFLLVSSQYVYSVGHWFTPLPILLFPF
jgi:hypothetical protein